MKRDARVVITGLGSVNAAGAGVAAFLSLLREGRCAIGPMTLFSTEGFRTHRAAVAPEVDSGSWGSRAVGERASRSDRFALAAAAEAWSSSGIGDSALPAEEIGVAIGGTTGGMLEGEEMFRRVTAGEASRFSPGGLASFPVSSSATVVAHGFGCRGPRLTVSTACSSSANSIALASAAIRRGRATAMLAGGTETHCRLTFAGFNALQAIDPETCRPFDRRRAGLSLGEGAAVLVLEDEAHARRRGATVYAEFAGFGVSADAHHMTAPDPDGKGAVLAMRRALEDARLAPEEIQYVNAHGTGTPQNDPAETRAIRRALGAAAERVAVSSTKSQVGHCLGAAGAIEILATVLAIHHGFLPPTVNLEEPDPECDLDYVARDSREATIHAALSNSYGFGGNDTSVALRRYTG